MLESSSDVYIKPNVVGDQPYSFTRPEVVRAAIRAHGFQAEHREYHAHSAGTGGHEDVVLAELARPTSQVGGLITASSKRQPNHTRYTNSARDRIP